MTYQYFCITYGVSSMRITTFAGYKSSGIQNFLKPKTYNDMPYGVRRAIKLMAVNMHFIYHNQNINDDPDWFIEKMHASNIRVFSKELYKQFTFTTNQNFQYKIRKSEALCRQVCLFVWTGIYLFIGCYDEGLTSSQHDLNTLPPDTNSTSPR